MTHLDREQQIEAMITPAIDAMEYDLVRVLITGKIDLTLQIMAERKDGAQMDVEDCAAISREISAILDVEDPMQDAYSLEVSSPGLDRPLVRVRDFERYSGFDIKLEMAHAIDGRKKFKGQLLGIKNNLVEMDSGAERIEVPFDDIRQAKLILTDQLLAAAAEGANDRAAKE
jgi:ribosome maturation factor RimP